MKSVRFLTTTLALAALGIVYAQDFYEEEFVDYVPETIMRNSIIEDTQVMYFGSGEVNDSTKYRTLLNQYYEDQFRHSQDPRAPYFMLMSRNGNLAMGIGGDLKVIGSYDWHGSIDGPCFIPYNIAIPANPAANDLLQFTPNRTGIFFSVFGNDDRFGKFQIYIHGRFNGDHNTFKLDRAYATVGEWTFGYTKSTFDDPIAQPATIDVEGPNSEIDENKVLARYIHDLSKKFSFALSVESANSKIPTATEYEPIKNTMPDIGAFFQYAYNRQHVRISAIAKSMGYRNMVKGENNHVLGWGINCSAKLMPVDALTVYASFNTGQGIGGFVNDLSYGENDLLGSSTDLGTMYAPRSFGWYGALQYHYSPTVFSTLIFSQERLLPKGDSLYGDNQYKYGLYGTANVFWNIAPRVQVGAEFNIGKRCNMDGSDRIGYRAAMSAEFSF